MLLSKIVEYLFTSTGQFIGGNLSANDLDMGALWSALEPEVYNYTRFCPIRKHFNIHSPYSWRYDLTLDPNNVGYSTNTATTISASESLTVTSTQTFMMTLPHLPIYPLSVQVSIDDVVAASDNGVGVLVFTDDYSATYSGDINYVTGVVTITAVDIASPVTIAVVVDATYIVYGELPQYISKMVPVGLTNVFTVLALFTTQTIRNIFNPNRVIDPRMFRFEYVKPVIYFSEAGKFDIIAHYNHQIIKTVDDNGNILDVELVDIEDSSNYYVLLQLLSARFLMILARSRRAFSYTDLPLTTDAAQLFTEADQAYKDAFKLLTERHNWSSAVRP